MSMLIGMIIGVITYFILCKIELSYGNWIEETTEEVVVTSKYMQKTKDEYGRNKNLYYLVYVYKGDNKVVEVIGDFYSKINPQQKVKVDLKLWYKKGLLRRLELLDIYV